MLILYKLNNRRAPEVTSAFRKDMKKLTTPLLVLIAIAISGCGINTSPGTNEKVGTIVSFHKVGLSHDTWEASIIRGGFQGGTGAMGAAFSFTVEEDALIPKVRTALEAGYEVKITYRSEGLYSTFRTESRGHFLTSIEPLHTATK